MASNYTSNYGLCQWEPNDKVLRTEFNADNAKIDAAIAAVDSRVDGLSTGKASASALDSLKSTVDALSATVASQGNTLKLKGNCQIAVSSYTGNAQSTRTHSFARKPAAVFVLGDAQIVAIQGCASAFSTRIGDTYTLNAAWSGNSVTFSYTGSATSSPVRPIGNLDGHTYFVVALFDMSV